MDNGELYIGKFRYIPIITGPTASGKSAAAMEVCRMAGGEIISADSMQIYKGLDIGTAKDSKEELMEIKHHLTDIIDPSESFSVYDYNKAAVNSIADVLSRDKLPVVCGGTGQYISSLVFGIDYGNEQKEDISKSEEKYKKIYEEQGTEALYKILEQEDPDAAMGIHPNNVRRVIRALAVKDNTGTTFSEKNKSSMKSGPSYRFKIFMPGLERSVIYDRINRRVDIMMDNGLIEEARKLYDNPEARQSTCYQAIGYKEFADYFDGKIPLEKVSYEIKLRSRHYAKRQLTWFRWMKAEIILLPDADLRRQAEFVIDSCKA